MKKEHESIIKHELVHIEQKHSWDLLFFEFLRIIFWFNPLVYVYQKRTSELHEFIADATVAKTHRKEQYQMLLSQVFQTEEISFVNHFFKSSLIKKRIVMLQKTKSKKVWQLKYLLLIPIVIGMLVYTSSEAKELNNSTNKTPNASIVVDSEFKNNKEIYARKELFTPEVIDPVIPFSEVDQVPIFPGCKDAEDLKACFNTAIQKHIRKHFRYPEEAQKKRDTRSCKCYAYHR